MREQDTTIEVGTVLRLSPSRDDQVYIYALCDPRDDTVRYIGQSSNPIMRLRTHAAMSDGTAAKKEWIAELRANGLAPYLEVLEVVDWREADRAERRAIGAHVARGCDLTNWPLPWKARAGDTLHLAGKVDSALYNAVVDVAWEEGWGMAQAVRHLLGEALAARAATVPAPPAPQQEAQS